MLEAIVNGARVPAVNLGRLDHGVVASVNAENIFEGKRSVVLGVPGAFTPVCTKEHVPDFVRSANQLVASGFDQLLCVAPNDPFVLEAWQSVVDPCRKLTFFSDGNLDFCRALGLSLKNEELFLGVRSRRYMLIVDHLTIQRVRVEANILTFACTRAEEALLVE